METPGPASGSGVPPAVLEPVLAELRAMDDDPRFVNKQVQESFTVSPATKAVLIFLTQERQHVCINNELDDK